MRSRLAYILAGDTAALQLAAAPAHLAPALKVVLALLKHFSACREQGRVREGLAPWVAMLALGPRLTWRWGTDVRCMVVAIVLK